MTKPASASSRFAVSWPADHVARRPVSALVPSARNARTHSQQQVAQIAASITEWGWTVPVLVDEGSQIIAGHGRVLAARSLGITEVPVMVASDWSPEQKRAYLLADNQLALNAGWDEDLLRLELGELANEGFDLSLTGFSEDELARLRLFGEEGLTDPDDTPELPVVPVTQLGDLWCLGKHRLLCGDSTNADDVARVLEGVVPHLMVTDPPYGVEYDPATARAASAGSARGTVLNDHRADWRDAWALFPGTVAYVWHAALRSGEVVESLRASGFGLRAQIIWDKGQPVISRGHYHWSHEPCWYAVREGATAQWAGDRKQTTIWNIAKPKKNETGHATQKPVECMRRPIENNSSAGQAVYEPFSGSGTTIIAAEMGARICHAVELSPAYVDVTVQRWQAFTGKVAVFEATGQGFAQVAAERGVALSSSSHAQLAAA